MTMWLALDADCAVVQQRFEHETGVSVQSLKSLIIAEPDSALFQVPLNFEEVPPSGLYVPVCGPSGRCSSVPDAVKQKLDRFYYALRGQN